jgi:hypothetical protein
LSRALPGSKAFLRFCFPLGGIHFALGGVLYSPVAWLKNIKEPKNFFESKIDLLWVNYTICRTFWFIWQNTYQFPGKSLLNVMNMFDFK